MRGAATFRLMPGNQQGAFARVVNNRVTAPVVVEATPEARQLVWRQRFIQRTSRTRLFNRSVKYTFTDFGIRQVFIGH